MKNIKKMVAAGVLGVALLAGTSYTFATWHVSDTASVGRIQTGSMDVKIDEIKDWTRYLDDQPREWYVEDIHDVPLVPGNSLVGTFEVDATLVGADLVAEFDFAMVPGEDEDASLDMVYVPETNRWVVVDRGPEGTGNRPTNIYVTIDTEQLSAPVSVGQDGETIDGNRPMDVKIVFDRIAPTSNEDHLYDASIANAVLGNLQLILTQKGAPTPEAS